MKAAIWYGRRDIRVAEVPEPGAPGPGQAQVKVRWCGICGSDLHEYTSGPMIIPTQKPHPMTGKTAPVIMGHEFSGDVVAVGEGAAGFQVGDRVIATAFERCGTCYWCQHGQSQICRYVASLGLHRDGALAEYVNVPAYTLHRLPPALSYELAALVEPLAVAVHAVRQGGVQPGSTVAVFGAGPIGLSVLQAARAAGAARVLVFEIAQRRQRLALALGAEAILDPREPEIVRQFFALTSHMGVDVSFDCAGAPASAPMAIEVVRRGGRAVIVAVFEQPSQLHFNRVMFFEKQVVGAIGYSDEFPATIALLADGRLRGEPLISAKIGLRDIVAHGFEALVERKDEHVKILVSPEA